MAIQKMTGEESSFQRESRRGLKAFDQHGRTWEATVETKTMAPIGEPFLVRAKDRVTGQPIEPPILPPAGMMRWPKDELGRVYIDYEAWAAQRRAALADWTQNFESYAQSMYGDRAHEAIEHPTPALLRIIGPKPAPVEQVLACQRGNKWALGLPTADGRAPERPDWADRYFPLPKAEAPEEFPDVGEDAAQDPDADPDSDPGSGGDEGYPRLVKLAGAKTRWALSDGTEYVGTKEKATLAEAKLHDMPLAGATT